MSIDDMIKALQEAKDSGIDGSTDVVLPDSADPFEHARSVEKLLLVTLYDREAQTGTFSRYSTPNPGDSLYVRSVLKVCG